MKYIRGCANPPHAELCWKYKMSHTICTPFCCALFGYGYVIRFQWIHMAYVPITYRVAALVLWQSYRCFFVQDCSIPSALAMGILQSCTNPSVCLFSSSKVTLDNIGKFTRTKPHQHTTTNEQCAHWILCIISTHVFMFHIPCYQYITGQWKFKPNKSRLVCG